ncbi:hypothetical protein DFH28DRAFT_275621 [Melampsora americana]|nr:hypothetical protein DFH28DRAFT_275621 [Melampsora americana]
MNFNLDWDEPDIWSTEPSTTTTNNIIINTSTPTSSFTNPSIQINPSSSSELSEPSNLPSSPTNQSDSSETTTIQTHPIKSSSSSSSPAPPPDQLTFTLSQPTPTDSESGSGSGSRTPDLNHHPQPNLSISTEFIPNAFHTIDLNQTTPNSPSVLFSSPSDESSNQSMFSASGEGESNPSNSLNQVIDDDEDEFGEFGEFDDGDENGQGLGGKDGFDEFDRFSSSSTIPPNNHHHHFGSKSKMIPFKLPEEMNFENLKHSLTPALDQLFDQIESSTWFMKDPRIGKGSKAHENELQKDFSSRPFLLNEFDVLQSTWDELIKDDHGLGVTIDWKRSQIRRHLLVTLGIPVDLNDFLTPTNLPKPKISLTTDSISSNLLHPFNSSIGKPIIKSPTLTISLDRKRCDEVLSFNNEHFQTQTDEELMKIRDELKFMNKSISDLLSQTLTNRDKLDQDHDSYNRMISDLITAAQRIKMGSPHMNKRSSSIQLGSSSISSTAHPQSSRWFGGSRSITPTHQPSPSPSTAHHLSKSIELHSKRSSVL